MTFADRYGPWAVVAGASTGLGAEFARQLAGRKLHLVLLARRAERLEALAAELRARDGVAVRVAAIDLAAPDLLARLRDAVDGVDVGLLVYNAAQSLIGPFLEQPLDDKLRILDVNCRGTLILVDELARRLAARGRGGVIVMSSLAASRGSPLVATYAATKAFGLVLAEGLWHELGARGVDVLACRAGATRTETYEASQPADTVPLMECAPVVRQALDALGRRPSIVPGWLNRVGDFVLARLLPRRAAIRVMARATRSMYPRLGAPSPSPSPSDESGERAQTRRR
jgi:short-subunit dehydrogenase